MRKPNSYYEIVTSEETKKYKPEEELRTERLYIRVTEDEKKMITKLAKLQHMDNSTFVRWVILGKYIDEFIK